MIKKSLLVLLTALFLSSAAVVAQAQTIYLFLGGNTNDKNIGQCVESNIGYFGFIFTGYLPEDQVVIYNHSKTWKGPEIFASGNVKQNILTAIQNCPAKPSDKIVFYWSGYGDFDRHGHYIFLSKDRRQSQVMYRSEILNALQNKGASLTVLITDACRDYRNLPMELGMSCPAYEGIPPLHTSLFLNCKGVVDINSSHPGETSYCGGISSVFTHNFVTSVFGNINKYMNWDSFLKGVQNDIRHFDYFYKDYNLHFNQRIYTWGTLAKSTGAILPENGDRIISVNGIQIRDMEHFSQVIRDADAADVTFTLVDHRTGKPMILKTDLNPPGSYTRLGIYIQSDARGGVMVTGLVPGSPGTRCWRLDNDSDKSDRSKNK